jgi:hypothetical protein
MWNRQYFRPRLLSTRRARRADPRARCSLTVRSWQRACATCAGWMMVSRARSVPLQQRLMQMYGANHGCAHRADRLAHECARPAARPTSSCYPARPRAMRWPQRGRSATSRGPAVSWGGAIPPPSRKLSRSRPQPAPPCSSAIAAIPVGPRSCFMAAVILQASRGSNASRGRARYQSLNWPPLAASFSSSGATGRLCRFRPSTILPRPSWSAQYMIPPVQAGQP